MANPRELQMLTLRDLLEKSGAKILARRDVKEGREIGRGGYGRILMGTLKADHSRVVIKRMLASKWDIAQVKLFCKEIKLLSEITHPNIVRLRGVCLEPLSPVLEYLEFNLDEMRFPETEGSREGSTLAELLSILAEADLVEEVGVKRGVLHKAAVDVAMGLAFLHHNNICHRDLKPANILVTNSRDLVTCKLADFGEARANHLQTASVVHSVTEHVQRGTKLFFAPEQLLKTLASADTPALKRVDIWCYGMIVFCLLSPDLESPWERELIGQANLDNVLKAMTANKLPRGLDKYKHLPGHTGLGSVHQMCCHYDPAKRPGIDALVEMLTNISFSRINTGSSASPAAREHGDNADSAHGEAGRTLNAADSLRVGDVLAKSKQVPVYAEKMLKAADYHWDAAAYGGLWMTGLVGEEARPGRLHYPLGMAAHGDLLWVVDRASDRVVVFQRTTESGHTGHHYVAESPVHSPRCVTATDAETWISQGNDQLQGVRLQGGEVVLTRTLPATGRLADPRGLAYSETSRTLLVCCVDGVHMVDVARGVVVGTLDKPPEVQGEQGWRPRYACVLQDTILVAYGRPLLVLYTGDGGPGRVLELPGLTDPRGITHNGDHFVLCDLSCGSLLVVSREGEAVTRVGLGEVRPRCISRVPHQRIFYVTDDNKDKLWVVSR